MDKDRTETNDLAAKYPERVKEMEKKWFEIAKGKERLKGRHLSPVKESLAKLNFRRDTSSGSAASGKRRSEKNKDNKN